MDIQPTKVQGPLTNQPAKQANPLCIINILFPVINDEQAIRVNSAINAVLDGVEGVRREMRITSGPLNRP